MSMSQAGASDDCAEVVEKWLSLSFTWAGKSFPLDIADSDRLDALKEYEPYGSRCRRIFDLKVVLFSMTDVPPERQKILGLVKGKLPPDDEWM